MSVAVEFLGRDGAATGHTVVMERIAKLALVLLLSFNAVLLLYPRQLPGVELVDRAMFILSSYVSPLLMASMQLFGWLSDRRLTLQRSSVVPIALCTTVYMVSAVLNGPTLKGVAVATYFGLAAYGVQYAWRRWPSMAKRFISITTVVLAVWCLVAMGLLLTPVGPLLVNTDYGYSFHGFADSRIMYGAWGSIALLLVATSTKPSWKVKVPVLSCLLFGLFLSRSRSAMLGILIVVVYATVKRGGLSLKTLALSVTFCIFAMVAVYLWAYLGRADALEFYNSDRWNIVNGYLGFMQDHSSPRDVLFGQAQQISIAAPAGGLTQAHNLLLQWYVNWGALGLVSLIGYLVTFWLGLKASAPKMILIVFAVFSLMLPIQGTENFFSPVTLMVFVVVSSLGNPAVKAKTRL